MDPHAGRFVVESNYTKFKRMNGYQCNGHSAMSVLYHLHVKFQHLNRDGVMVCYYSESELLNAYRKGRIKIIMIGGPS
jgi:hypothetical protein